MFTRIKQENGWDHLNDLREKFNGKVFKVNEQIISRFQIKNTPVLISTEKDKFRITQFSEAEIRGVGEKISAEENWYEDRIYFRGAAGHMADSELPGPDERVFQQSGYVYGKRDNIHY